MQPMNPDVRLLRRGVASVLASAIFLATALPILISPWDTPTPEDAANDSWIHGLIVLPFVFVALVPVSYLLGTLFLRQGHKGIIAFTLRAGVWITAFAFALFAPAAIVAGVIGFGALGQVVAALGAGFGLLLIQGLPAALAWRLVAGHGPSAPTVREGPHP
jgi:hypothetical protein